MSEGLVREEEDRLGLLYPKGCSRELVKSLSYVSFHPETLLGRLRRMP